MQWEFFFLSVLTFSRQPEAPCRLVLEIGCGDGANRNYEGCLNFFIVKKRNIKKNMYVCAIRNLGVCL